MTNHLMHLPDGLPVPQDDGACRHLPGLAVSSVVLTATTGNPVDLHAESQRQRVVVYVYPMTGQPDTPLPEGWDTIPGARGCTPQSCAFRDHHDELKELGAVVYGLSTQETPYQQEMAERLHLPFPILSDAALHFAEALRLPTFSVHGMTLIRRLTLILHHGQIEHVFYPVFPPSENADAVLRWLRSKTSGHSLTKPA